MAQRRERSVVVAHQRDVLRNRQPSLVDRVQGAADWSLEAKIAVGRRGRLSSLRAAS